VDIKQAVHRNKYHPAIVDYHMSKEFGLDWKEYECDRVMELMTVMGEIAKRDAKQNAKQNNKFRPRM